MRILKFAAAWGLRQPERVLDIVSIILLSAGINLLTSTVESEVPLRLALAGSTICAAGVLLALLRYQVALLRDTINDVVRAKSELLKNSDHDSTFPEQWPTYSALLKSVIDDYLEYSHGGNTMGLYVIGSALLCVIGLLATVQPTYRAESSLKILVSAELAGIRSQIDDVARSFDSRSLKTAGCLEALQQECTSSHDLRGQFELRLEEQIRVIEGQLQKIQGQIDYLVSPSSGNSTTGSDG